QWTTNLGWACHEVANRLRLSPRTLRQWHVDLRQQRLRLQPLGRPTCRSSVGQRNDVIALIDELGPRIGVPTLRDCFPRMARAELEDLLKRYRRLWRKRHQQALHVLHWQVPGTLWAMDYTEAPAPLDGLYRYVLAIRDPPSGQQLLAHPVAIATADEALLALQSLLALHGPPLVLKTDNGSPFCAGPTLDFLHQTRVIPLFSPPRTPRYNGAIEA